MSEEYLIYFAHPKSTYGSPLEKHAIEELLRDGWDVCNPADHQAGYVERGMQHFLDLATTCGALAYLPFADGSIGAGVAREILEAQLDGKPIFKIDPVTGNVGKLTTPFAGVLTIEETRARLAA